MKKVLLIADDNLDNILLIKRIVRRSGLDLDLVEAHTGREAISSAVKKTPDVILMDLKMPDLDGFEAAAEIKAKSETSGVPIIAVTAQMMSGDRDKALSAGCDAYLSKPIDPKQLIDLVKGYLADRPGDGV